MCIAPFALWSAVSVQKGQGKVDRNRSPAHMWEGHFQAHFVAGLCRCRKWSWSSVGSFGNIHAPQKHWRVHHLPFSPIEPWRGMVSGFYKVQGPRSHCSTQIQTKTKSGEWYWKAFLKGAFTAVGSGLCTSSPILTILTSRKWRQHVNKYLRALHICIAQKGFAVTVEWCFRKASPRILQRPPTKSRIIPLVPVLEKWPWHRSSKDWLWLVFCSLTRRD